MGMSEFKYKCFVIMPFLPELHYFYLYLQQHIQQRYTIQCERGDTKVLTEPLSDKIDDYIKNADVIIADCSGRNPNVFYELGIAHAHDRKVILITKDAVQEAPIDIRHFEFIHYELDKDVEFFRKLDNALHNVFVSSYESLYERAKEIFREFRNVTHAQAELASQELFLPRVMDIERTQRLPSMDDTLAVTRFLLPRIIADANDADLLEQITNWLSEKERALKTGVASAPQN